MPLTIPMLFVAGSREWRDRAAVYAEIEGYPAGTLLLHGGCRGADQLAHEVGTSLGFQTIQMDANWDALGKQAGPKRNAAMLDVLLALKGAGFEVRSFLFHDDLAQSKGTSKMARLLKMEGFQYKHVRHVTGGVAVGQSA